MASSKRIDGQDVNGKLLHVDAAYEGRKTPRGGIQDPLTALLGVSRQGGFRYRGSRDSPKLVVLVTNLSEAEWPDELDPLAGRFVYYGDNRHPGRALHDTPRFGNLLLRSMFEQLHAEERFKIPPVLIFANLGQNRSVKFLGLAVPGASGVPQTEDLVAVWKNSSGERFQNYRAVFTILDISEISRAWLEGCCSENSSGAAPAAWLEWREKGTYRPLRAGNTGEIRSRAEQLPQDATGKALLSKLRERYLDTPTDFEICAAAVAKLLLPNIDGLDLTRPWRDGGRDGVGFLRLGQGRASIRVTFALEAKCYSPQQSVSVRDSSRLIARIRHREFGVLVTTSALNQQAYAEIVSDGHPVIIVAGTDIVTLLRKAGITTVEQLKRWLITVHDQPAPRLHIP